MSGIVRVAAGILWRDGKVLACQRDAEGLAGNWEFPGGRVEDGESPEDALRRELREELDVQVHTAWPYDTIQGTCGQGPMELELFVCPLPATQEPHPIVHSQLRWLSHEELLDVDWLPADLTAAKSLGIFWDQAFTTEVL